MRIFISIIILLLFFAPLKAQEDIISSIKEQYIQVSTNTDDYNIHKVELNSILPAVGPKTKIVTFYHKSVQTNPEIDPYNMTHTLLKVTVSYNISARSTYSCEYLYNKNGHLIFYFDKLESGFENYQKRYYYNNSNLIKCIIKSEEEGGETLKYTKTSSFLDENISGSKSGIIKAKQYFDYFLRFKALDKLD